MHPADAYMEGWMDGRDGLPPPEHPDLDYARGWGDARDGLTADPHADPQTDQWPDPQPDQWPEPPPRPADGRYRVLMVCTGNTSRSALAAAAARAAAPPWLLVASAGTGALDGEPASAKSSAAAAGMGLDLSGHRSSELAPGPLAAADEVWCMTRRHMEEVLAAAPWAAPKLRLLDPAGDIADPHGGGAAAHRATAATVAAAVRRRVSGLRRPGRKGGRAARRAAEAYAVVMGAGGAGPPDPAVLSGAEEIWCATRRHVGEAPAAAPWAWPKIRLRPEADGEGEGAARRAARRIAAFRVSAWWSREMLGHKVGRLDLNPEDSRRFRALCDRFLASCDWDYLHDMCYWAASFLGVACRELGIPLRVATGRYSPEGGEGFDHAWLEDASGMPFDIVAVAHARHRRDGTRDAGVVGAADFCPACGRFVSVLPESGLDLPDCECENPPEPERRTRRFADEDEALDAGYEVAEREPFPEWVPEFVEPGRYDRNRDGGSEEAAYQLGFGPEEEEDAREMAREVAATCSAPGAPERRGAGRAAATRPLNHGPTFRSWQAKARRAIKRAFSGVGEEDESDWFARAKSALAETLPHAMYRGFSVQAADEGEARRLAEAAIAGTTRPAPHSFSRAVARSFALGVEPWWAAAGSVSSEGRKHRDKAGQWGAIASVEVSPDMVDWGCLDSGNSMFGDAVYCHLPFGEPVPDAMARMLVDYGGTHNAEWDLEVRPYPSGSASIEVFRIGSGSAERMEGFWRSKLGGAKEATIGDTLEWWNTCSRCGSDLSVAGRAGDDEDRPLCRSCWGRLTRPAPEPTPRRWWRWRPAAARQGWRRRRFRNRR